MKHNNDHKKQHFVSECILKKWREKSSNPKDPKSKLSFFDSDGKVKTINYRDNSRYFAGNHYLEFDKDDPTGRIEKKLAYLECQYSNFAQRIIDNESLIKQNKGMDIDTAGKGVVYTFIRVQKHRSNMPPETKPLERTKKLRKIESILDAYIKFRKMKEEEFLQSMNSLGKEYDRIRKKFKYDYRKANNAFLKMISNPLNRLIYHIAHERYTMGLKYFDNQDWPLPVSGSFEYALGLDDFGIDFTFVPITPRIVLAFVWVPEITQQDMKIIQSRYSQSFGKDTLFSTMWDIAAYWFKISKIPIVIPESWDKNLEIKNHSERIYVNQKKLKVKYENNVLAKKEKIKAKFF